ncbi:hypothetical protein M378DRAFT_18253 [Amanita muscaria Koide BX008]|uniref:ATP-citrate synthase citrate-binding domain-containing protein n=1 Tax=Amanita muscaria (strain Koide BX008) TaxID=946122 RepID=A0A0C2WG84_AMAMK|nr:hypothetical protein M378DRAFT_18253 [Amanita muscaria Koide BX008]
MPLHGLSDSPPPARAALIPRISRKAYDFHTTKSTKISLAPHNSLEAALSLTAENQYHASLNTPTTVQFIYTIIVPLVSEKFRVDAAKFIKLPQLSAIQSGQLRATSLSMNKTNQPTISNQASNKVYIKNPDASIGASLKLTFLNAEGRGWAMVPGGAPDIRVCENYLWEDGGGITNFTNIATIMKKYKSPLTEGLKATRLGESRGVPIPVFDPEAFTTEIVPRRPGQEERRSRWKSAEVDIPACVTTAEQQLENANGGVTHSDGECTQPGD